MRKLSDVKDAIGCDTIARRAGVVTVRDEFFYQHGRTSADLVRRVMLACPDATILDSGEVWKAFRGGASTANSSHWFVRFTLPHKEAS